jgi:phosphatidylinositol alpha-1,6-mannosyltransferase
MCDRIIANSEFTLAKFREVNPRFADIPSGVCYLPARSLGDGSLQSGQVDNRSSERVLIVGRLWGRGLRKGQRELIRVWPKVLCRFPSAQLCIVGGGQGYSELKQLISSLGITDSVHLTGPVSDEELTELYAGAAVYAMPSEGEGFGLVFAEAMARGLPCIASRSDAGQEVVVDGVTGFTVDREKPDELLRAVCTLLGDEDLRRRMGGAGRRRVIEKFSLASFNDRMERVLRGD